MSEDWFNFLAFILSSVTFLHPLDLNTWHLIKHESLPSYANVSKEWNILRRTNIVIELESSRNPNILITKH